MRETDDSSKDRAHVFEVLQHRVRRAALLTLRNLEEPIEVDRLAEEVSAATEDDRSVAINLHHLHLPRLSDAGLVDYDRANQKAELSRESPLEPNWTRAVELQ